MQRKEWDLDSSIEQRISKQNKTPIVIFLN